MVLLKDHKYGIFRETTHGGDGFFPTHVLEHQDCNHQLEPGRQLTAFHIVQNGLELKARNITKPCAQAVQILWIA